MSASPIMRRVNGLAAEALCAVQRAAGGPLRVLEVGAGTGATTASLLPMLEPGGTTFSRTIPTCSWTAPGIASEVRRAPRSANSTSTAHEAEQGLRFRAGSRSSSRPTRSMPSVDLPAALRRLRRLLAPGGMLILVEATTDFAWFDLTIAVVEGWQHFADNARTEHPLLTPAEWQRVLADAGFAVSAPAWPHEASPAFATLPRPAPSARRRARGNVGSAPTRPAQSSLGVLSWKNSRPCRRLRATSASATVDAGFRHPGHAARSVAAARAGPTADGFRHRLAHGGRAPQRAGRRAWPQRKLPATLFFDHPTVPAIAAISSAGVRRPGQSRAGACEPAAAPPSVSVDALEAMSDEEIEALLNKRLEAM